MGAVLNKEESQLDRIIRENGWLPLSELSNRYAQISEIIHVDTRDFHFNVSFGSQVDDKVKNFIEAATSSSHPDFLTYEEVIERLLQWKIKSGGDKKWRMVNHYKDGWFKYVRILNTKRGYLWCKDHSDSYKFYTNRNLKANMEFEQYE